MVSTQKRNSEMVDLLRPDFQARYEPNFAWVNALSAFSLLPGLRGLWPMSAVGDAVGGVNSDVTDMSSQGRHLTNTGQAQHGQSSLIPYTYFDGTNDYLSRADEAGLDIIGNEAYVEAASNGLTIGGWFNPSRLSHGNHQGLIGKLNTVGNQRSYLLYIPAGGTIANMTISSTGADFPSINSTVTMSTGNWYFIVGRFDPSTEISIFVNGTIDSLLVGVPAAIFNSNADFNIMDFNNGSATYRCHGYASNCFLTASFVPDIIIDALFQQTRAMYGV